MAEPASDHAALMDGVYRYQRYIYDLTRKYYLFGRDRLIDELALAPGERVVEVGCGTARNLIRMARLYPEAQLYGVDASHEMLKTASRAVARAGLGGKIRLAHGYAEALSPSLFGETRPFDRIVFSYALSMIPDWRQALRAADGALAATGTLHVVDFGDLMGLGRAGRRLMLTWLSLFHVEPRVEILRGLETMKSENRPANKDLGIVMGRYAFLWHCGKGGISQALG